MWYVVNMIYVSKGIREYGEVGQLARAEPVLTTEQRGYYLHKNYIKVYNPFTEVVTV